MAVIAERGAPPAIPDSLRPAEYLRLAREISGAQRTDLQPLRVAMLASSTLEFLRPVMVVEGARAGYGVDLLLGDFGQLEQPIVARHGALYSPPPDVLVLAFQPADLSPDIFDRYHASNGAALAAVCSELTDRLIGAARTFREHARRPVLVANFATPAALPLGPFDANDPNSLTHRLAACNAAMAQRVHTEPDVYVWDYAGLVRETGAASWTDSRLRMMARVTVAVDRQPAMAKHLLRTITALTRRPAKCLVLDLDNTLWGGVIGDDGPEGIQLGDDWPGSMFKAFQRTVLGLRDRGILLAIVSKNDEAVVAEVFRTHREMLISWDQVAAARVNWDPKSQNMRSIAEELNIGTDALVLFDDNPVERAEVRAGLPEARVVEVPRDPSRYSDALVGCGYFDQPGLSEEDFGRAEMYRTDRARSSLREEAPSIDDFLRSLSMSAEVGRAGRENLIRIAQLVGKTNQFNLTTRRHAPAELAGLAASDESVVAYLRLSDRFGDQGLVLVAILRRLGSDAIIDTFLMSCRVMNRGVERAMMAYLAEQARSMGCRRLIGEYRPTAKNRMVERFFPDLGFDPHGDSDGGTLWTLDLLDGADAWPSHITRNEPAHERVEEQTTT